VGVARDSKFFRVSTYRAHRTVIFTIAGLSCYLSTTAARFLLSQLTSMLAEHSDIVRMHLCSMEFFFDATGCQNICFSVSLVYVKYSSFIGLVTGTISGL